MQSTSQTYVFNSLVAGDGLEYQRSLSFFSDRVNEGTIDEGHLAVEVEATTVEDSRSASVMYLRSNNYESAYDMVEVVATTFWEDTIVNTTNGEKNYRFDFWVSTNPPSSTLPGLSTNDSMQVHLNGVLIWDYFTALPTLEESPSHSNQANVVLNLGDFDVNSSFILSYSSTRHVQWDLDFLVPYGNGYDDASSGDPHYYYPGNEITVHPVPIPGAMLLLLSGLGAFGFTQKQYRNS
ncbi:MAG: VPLPA-CTERM sorting domain-containing protein [Gammaproteobacteria bacterium]